MTLPVLSLPDHAEAIIGAVLDDERVGRLRHAFSPDGGLQAIVGHAEALSVTMSSPAEGAQLRRILTRWRSMIDERPGRLPAKDDLGALLRDADTWDMRLGTERDSMPTSVELFPPDTVELIMGIARDWHMTTAATPQGHFHAILPIGGLIRANLSRPAYAAQLLVRGTVATDMVVALASERATSLTEQALAKLLGAPELTEDAALEFGMEQAFGFAPLDWLPTAASRLKQGPTRRGVALFAGAAPPSIATGRRATTGEAFGWLLETSLLPSHAHVLQITSAYCWLANHVALLTLAPMDASVTTIGVPSRSEPTRSQRYLQEMKAFVDCLPRLRSWAQTCNSRAPTASIGHTRGLAQ